MPPSTSFVLRLPSRLPRIPYQFARMPNCVVGWAMIAGVHSTVWIFAISAALIRRAFSKSSSSVQSGCSAASRSEIALCSRVKSVCRSARPSQKLPATPVRSSLGVEVARQLAVRVEPQLAARALAERARDRRLAAVDLRAVPPVRVGRDLGRRRRRSRPGTGRCASARSASAARATGRRRRARARTAPRAGSCRG